MLSPRTLSVLTFAALSLAACGAPADGPSATATPQFLEPSTAPASVPAPASAPPPSATPSAAASTSPAAATSKPPAAAKGKAPVNVKYVFPVQASNVDYHPTHSGYPATDLFADCGEPFVATTSGVVLEISLKDAYVKGRPDGPLNGGLFVSILGDDGVRYYGSHLSKVQSGIEPGVRVRAGQQLGKVGRTGNANNVCHLHYGISPPCAEVGDWDVRRGVVWPAPYLTSWRKGGGKSPVAEVESWRKTHRCKG
ncbi:M23 family metallopeptidase [Couchioplanes azureus]|uniref:M23 family metallopeptidase n=1 Tax=Couchioplanes caeruleus TaxID=56438 RepID=UPI00166F78DF|nr:M23 family metallopeptidase [Couchioplanes caeruleus]GGQ44179.1 hypothetical protein GCM10010166_10860 [Couchioplanes caeruleus subsp. azureus]